MNRKPSLFEKIADFVAGKGFYFLVLACVAVIGLSGFVLVRSVGRDLTGERPDEPAGGTAHIVVTPAPQPSRQPQATPAPQPSQETVQATPAPAPTASQPPAVSQAPEPANLVFTWPVNGAVIVPFSVDVLSYDETMGDWRTHNGLDIAADLDTRVLCTAAGTVSAIYDDPLMGTTVIVEHGGGLTSLYANLAQTPAVQAGDEVYTGTVLGAVGDTAPAESGRTSHLHFAMYQDELPVDPENYLPEK